MRPSRTSRKPSSKSRRSSGWKASPAPSSSTKRTGGDTSCRLVADRQRAVASDQHEPLQDQATGRVAPALHRPRLGDAARSGRSVLARSSRLRAGRMPRRAMLQSSAREGDGLCAFAFGAAAGREKILFALRVVCYATGHAFFSIPWNLSISSCDLAAEFYCLCQSEISERLWNP